MIRAKDADRGRQIPMWDRLQQREISGHGLQPGPGQRPRPDLPAGADLIPQIKHIVVLMMENHSYDNYLGTLVNRGDGLPKGPDGTPEAVNVLPNGQRVAAHRLTSTAQCPGNPTQTWNASHISYADGTCGGFATSVWKTVQGGDPAVPMGYWTEDELPFYHDLARTFPVADRWFCSCLGATFPHRARPRRRPSVGPGGLPGGGDDLRRADHLRHLLGQLPQREPGVGGAQAA